VDREQARAQPRESDLIAERERPDRARAAERERPDLMTNESPGLAPGGTTKVNRSCVDFVSPSLLPGEHTRAHIQALICTHTSAHARTTTQRDTHPKHTHTHTHIHTHTHTHTAALEQQRHEHRLHRAHTPARFRSRHDPRLGEQRLHLACASEFVTNSGPCWF